MWEKIDGSKSWSGTTHDLSDGRCVKMGYSLRDGLTVVGMSMRFPPWKGAALAYPAGASHEGRRVCCSPITGCLDLLLVVTAASRYRLYLTPNKMAYTALYSDR